MVLTGLTFFLVAVFGLHLGACGLVLWRLRRATDELPPTATAPLTVLRPVCGLDADLARTLDTSFTRHASNYEVIFCIADPKDRAIGVVRQVMARHPEVPSQLLIGPDFSTGNPKLNNLIKGWDAARHDWIVMIDSNVLLPRDYVQRLFSTWDARCGLVTSPPSGASPQGFSAHLEAAFLNTYQDIWQLAGDQIGQGFAQGKVLFWRRDILENAGGLAALGHNMAEDVAATKVVRAAGLNVRVVLRPFPQPLGQRSFAEVWDRQVRWARVRRDGFAAVFALEIATGGLPPLIALIAMMLLGAVSGGGVLALMALWYGAQWAVAWRAGWERSAAQIGAWLARDALIPAVWIAALASRTFVWRGNAMAPGALIGGDPAPETVAPSDPK